MLPCRASKHFQGHKHFLQSLESVLFINCHGSSSGSVVSSSISLNKNQLGSVESDKVYGPQSQHHSSSN